MHDSHVQRYVKVRKLYNILANIKRAKICKLNGREDLIASLNLKYKPVRSSNVTYIRGNYV